MFDPLKLGLEAVMSCLVWVLGTQLWSSSRVVSALNHLSSSVVLMHRTTLSQELPKRLEDRHLYYDSQ